MRGAWPPQAWTLERNLLRHFGDHQDEAYLPGWDFSVIKKAESRSDGSLACTIDRSSECGYTKYSSHIVIYSDFLMDRRRTLFGFPHGPTTSPDSHRSPPLTAKSGEETLARKLTPGRTLIRVGLGHLLQLRGFARLRFDGMPTGPSTVASCKPTHHKGSQVPASPESPSGVGGRVINGPFEGGCRLQSGGGA